MPNLDNYVIIGDKRVAAFGPRIIRIERKSAKGFCDDKTLFAINRVNLDTTPIEVRKGKKNALIVNEDHEIELTPEIVGSRIYRVEGGERVLLKVIEKADFLHTGELPLPEATPEIYIVSESPRLRLSKQGYLPTKDPMSGYVFEQEVEDLYLVFADKNPFILRKTLLALVGPTPMPPLSAFGTWDSKYFVYTDATVDEEVANYKKYDLPLDNFVIDTDWRAAGATRGAGYKVNTDCFPDISATFARLHADMINVMFNDHPDPVEGASNLFDPKEVEFRSYNLDHLMDLGLDYWWYDRNWITHLVSPDEGKPQIIKAETLGMYLFNDVTEKHYAKVKKGKYPRRSLGMYNLDEVKNGKYKAITNIASHRYGIQWTGDTVMKNEYIGLECINLIKAGVSLNPYCHGDMTGHVNDGDLDLYLRYNALGIFSPIYRRHCTCDVKRFRQPWHWGEHAIEVCRYYDYLRYRMLPYWYSLSRVNFETGIPLTRALGFTPNEKTRYDEYKIGDALLYSPSFIPDKKLPVRKEMFVSPIKAAYWNNKELSGKPVYEETIDGMVDFDWEDHSPKDGVVNREDFSARFEFDFYNPYDEEVTLYIGSDDGARIYEDGKLIFENWSIHAYDFDEGPTLPAKSKHHYVIEYFQGKMGAQLHLEILPKSLIPTPDKDVYIPGDSAYLDLIDGHLLKPGTVYNHLYAMEQASLFAKMGSIIPLAKEALNTHDSDWSKLTLALFLDKDHPANFTLYEDDRESEGYLHGEYAKTRMSANYVESKGCFELTIDEAIGDYEGKIAERDYNFDVYLPEGAKLKAVRVDGVLLPHTDVAKSEKGDILPFEGPALSIDKATCHAKLDTASAHLIEFFLE